MRAILSIVLLLAGGFSSAASITHLWTIEGVFDMPESAAVDGTGTYIYLSNVNEYALDDNGFISRIPVDGKEVTRHWLTGVHSPTGVAIAGEKLYFADVDALVIADLLTARILRRIPAPDAGVPVLNDVAIAPDGTVYVSGSRSHTVYRLAGDTLEPWLQDNILLAKANGLFATRQTLVHGGARWTTFDRTSGQTVNSPVPAAELSDFDGIAADGDGGYYFTVIDDPRLWHLRADGKTVPLSDDAIAGIDIALHGDLLVVPRVGGTLSVYRVNR